MKPRNIPWYETYSSVVTRVDSAKAKFRDRCEQLGKRSEALLSEFQKDLLARTVRESNWQEGIELELGRTRELAEIAMDDLRFPEDGRLDIESIAEIHRSQVLELKRSGASSEEVATLSLARAHLLLKWIAQELAFRQTASLAHVLKQCGTILKRQDAAGAELPESVKRGLQVVERLQSVPSPAYGPLQGAIGTEGELLTRLLGGEFETLLHPMDVRYIHALHRIAMMGVLPVNQLGRWRRGMVHVGDPNILFPPPAAIDPMMQEYCKDFPAILPLVAYDPLMVAARVSYRFVRIHPYLDGNGRVSRLLMNLVLTMHHPMVSLSPRAKERHRYREAIRRADRGKLEPLACLIGIAVSDTYERMLAALASD